MYTKKKILYGAIIMGEISKCRIFRGSNKYGKLSIGGIGSPQYVTCISLCSSVLGNNHSV